MDLFDSLTSGSTGTLHAWSGTGYDSCGWASVVRDAERQAAGLRACGVERGMPVAAVLTNRREVLSGILAVWLAGGVVASLPVPARGMGLDEYGGQLRDLCERMQARLLVADEVLEPVLADRIGDSLELRQWRSLERSARIAPTPPGDDELAFVQYSSGSTGTPKGCMLTPAAIGAQLETIADMSEATPHAETVCSWLPLSHDMGVFGCALYAWAHGFDLALSTPERFMRAPRTWFGDAAAFSATQTAGTSSALHFAARAHRASPLDSRLRLRVCVVGAERIEWSTLELVERVLGPAGLAPQTLMPAYGLAEATLVVSAIGARERPSSIALDPTALADGEIRRVDTQDPGATRIVAVGRPCRGVDVRLSHADALAEIRVSSRSLFSGYHVDPALTAAGLRGDEVVTGDLGFFAGDQLYVVGRADDVLSVAGRKVYARELETAIGALEPVRTGCCTIVDVSSGDRTRLVMLIELRDGVARDSLERIAAAAARTAALKAGVGVDEFLFLPSGALPKTPTGKVQRFRCRELVRGDLLAPIARVAA